jgi:choline-sulfatase
VSLTDLASTIERAVGATPVAAQQDWQGRPLQDFIARPESERALLSEYHDGGSPCGFYMLRRGRWKLVFFSEGNPPLLFDIELDPREMTNLADDPAHASILQGLIVQLREILDPEEVNRQAFADQAQMIECLGGMDVIMAMPSFNHTPLD